MSPQGSYWTRPGRCPNNGRAENENHDQEGGKVKQRLLRIAFHLSLPNQEADRQGARVQGISVRAPPPHLTRSRFPSGPSAAPCKETATKPRADNPKSF